MYSEYHPYIQKILSRYVADMTCVKTVCVEYHLQKCVIFTVKTHRTHVVFSTDRPLLPRQYH